MAGSMAAGLALTRCLLWACAAAAAAADSAKKARQRRSNSGAKAARRGEAVALSALAERLRPLLEIGRRSSVIELRGRDTAPAGSPQLQEWRNMVEASRCAALLRKHLRKAARTRSGRSDSKRSIGPSLVVDVGVGPMLTAWLLREVDIVLSVSGRTAELAPALAPFLAKSNHVGSRLVHMPGEMPDRVLESLSELGIVPDLVFMQPSLVMGGPGKPSAAATPEEWAAITRARAIFPDVPVAGVMLTAEGSEVPHWVLPSLIAPVLGAANAMTVELPCWITGGCSEQLSPPRPLLTLTMIVKDESRRIRETLESVAPAVDRVVILDTGSQDGTQELVQDTCKRLGLPVELFQEPFVDFSTTRNRVLRLASNVTEFVLMMSGDETVVHAGQLRTFVQQHSGYCGSTEELFNIRVFMGPNTWYWSERLMRADNHASLDWPQTNNSWRYVGVTHEAYVNPERTMGGDFFINYVGDTDPSRARGLPAPVAGEFYISHDAERPAEKQRRRLWQDVRLLEGYLDRSDAPEDKWQYARSMFYLAQSHRGLGFADVAMDLWKRYLELPVAGWRQFSYLVYGAHMGLGQLCAEASARSSTKRLSAECRDHFESAHKLCPRAEPLVYLAMSLPSKDPARLDALQRAEKVAPLQASTGHCAIWAEPAVYAQLPQLLREASNA